MIDQLTQEKSTAENIKSKTTRKNVISALEKIIQYLKLFKQTPPNGLAVFAGNVSEFEGKEEIRLWVIEPPEKLETKIYWCDQVFVLDPLKEMLKEKDVYGLIVLDAREATIGLLRGKRIVVKKKMDSTVPSKTVKGGMCLHKATLVKLANGKEVPINKIKRGDEVLCFDFCRRKNKSWKS
jgi:peptide chain release factor subunit 1